MRLPHTQEPQDSATMFGTGIVLPALYPLVLQDCRPITCLNPKDCSLCLDTTMPAGI